MYASIRAAVACAQPGATIRIEPGMYTENILVDKSLTLQGAGVGQTVLDGRGAGRTVTVGDNAAVILQGVSITNGLADLGGGVYTYAGRITVRDSAITANTARLAGGGLYTFIGDVTLENTSLTDNHIAVDCTRAQAVFGGGLYTQIGRVQISGGMIAGNGFRSDGCLVEGVGVGVYAEAAQVTLRGVALTDEAFAAAQATLVTEAETLLTEAETVLTEATTAATGAVPLEAAQVSPPPATAGTGSTADTIAAADSAEGHNPTVAVAWMQVVLDAVKRERLFPPAAARVFAYAGVTVYEAIAPSMGHSLIHTLNGSPSLPPPDVGVSYDWTIVANHALATVTAGLFPNALPETQTALVALRDRIDTAQGEIVTINAYNRSVAYGAAVGEALLAWAATDNYAATRALIYTLPTGDAWYWSPIGDQRALEPYWGMLRPFVLPMANTCDVPPSVPFDTRPGSAFYQQAVEVERALSGDADEARQIAAFWADYVGSTYTPPGHWVSIQNQLVEQLDLSLEEAAHMYVLTNIALADAFIGAWEAKYRYFLIRPETYIQTYLDPTWTPLVPTPPFPEYPSGHSVGSGAAAEVLTALFGTVAFTDRTHEGEGMTRAFASFEAAAEEAALSRLYGGIHYRDAIENGLQQGRCVGQRVIARLDA